MRNITGTRNGVKEGAGAKGLRAVPSEKAGGSPSELIIGERTLAQEVLFYTLARMDTCWRIGC